jgi:hypothetical protein
LKIYGTSDGLMYGTIDFQNDAISGPKNPH